MTLLTDQLDSLNMTHLKLLISQFNNLIAEVLKESEKQLVLLDGA